MGARFTNGHHTVHTGAYRHPEALTLQTLELAGRRAPGRATSAARAAQPPPSPFSDARLFFRPIPVRTKRLGRRDSDIATRTGRTQTGGTRPGSRGVEARPPVCLPVCPSLYRCLHLCRQRRVFGPQPANGADTPPHKNKKSTARTIARAHGLRECTAAAFGRSASPAASPSPRTCTTRARARASARVHLCVRKCLAQCKRVSVRQWQQIVTHPSTKARPPARTHARTHARKQASKQARTHTHQRPYTPSGGGEGEL